MKDKSFFLFGPRGTGKTSWIQTHFSGAKVFDLLDSKYYQILLASPRRLEELVEAAPREQPIVIDEVQRVPDLLNEVHRLIESKKRIFILTGSSARKLRQRGVNLLAGRALTRFFFPLTCQELGSSFRLDRSLRYGHLPVAVTSDDPADFLRAYISTYLREEVQQEGLVRNLAAFSRFLEAASFSQAQILNISSVSRECHVDRKVVEDYFEILDDLLIAFRIPVFTKKAKRKLIKHQKFFFFDCGVYQAVRPTGPLDDRGTILGPALETLVVQEIRAINSYLNLGYDLSYWHTSDHKHEVDLICYGELGLKAFEVKASSRIREEDLVSLLEFQKDYPMAKGFILYGGTSAETRRGIEILPVSQALPRISEILQA